MTIPDLAAPDGSSRPNDDGGDNDAAAPETGIPEGGDDGADVVCPVVIPDDATGVYVAGTGTSAPTCGTRAAPCKTVAIGIARALAATPARAKVHVARGTYTEKITLSAGIELVGGWDVQGTDWKRTCVAPEGAVVLRAPGTSNVTVEARDLAGEARLSLLRIESKPAAQVKAGESLYGVVAVGAATTLVMNDVHVEMGDAGTGESGTKGMPGADGAPICAGGTGAPGAPGQQGLGAGAGTFDPAGYVAGVAAPGGSATAGGDGTAGGAGTCVTCGKCDTLLCFFTPDPEPTCGTGGTAGCGGATGGPGGPAGGGGSSVGVFAWDATITIHGGTIKSGDAGSGGAGGTAGVAGAPTKGAAGAPMPALEADCVTGCQRNLGLQCIVSTGQGLGGVAGGPGGTPGASGAGGGGSGGSSFAIYQGGAGVVSTTGGASLAHGKAGSGGGPAGGAGAVGAAADRVP